MYSGAEWAIIIWASFVVVALVNGFINAVDGVYNTTGYFKLPDSIVSWIIIAFVFGVSIVTFMFIVTAVNSDKHSKQLQQNPEIIQIGTFEGCKVSYVNRGYQSNSFYLAKCDNVETRTAFESHPKRSPTITTSIVVK